MKAMILAAGLGTRLQPFTLHSPKALAKIENLTLLEILITRLKKFGFNEIVINIHHFAEKIVAYVEKENYFGITIHFSDEKDQLLDTGGGIVHARRFFDEDQPFLVHNVDVLSNIDLEDMASAHKKSNAIATLAVRRRDTSRYFMFDDSNQLCGWKNTKTGEQVITNPAKRLHDYGFSGIHMISPRIFKLIQSQGSFSIVAEYLRLSKEHKIIAYPHNDSVWMDLGDVHKLKSASRIIHKVV
jgi:NDP-sugar pyrophosphorylase family protein